LAEDIKNNPDFCELQHLIEEKDDTLHLNTTQLLTVSVCVI